MKGENKMKIGINSSACCHYASEFECFDLAKECGFDAFDYGYYLYCGKDSEYNSDLWIEHAKKIKKKIDELGLVIYQIHAPLIKKIGIDPNEEYLIEMTKRSFQVAQILGCQYVVVHPRKYQNAKTVDEIEKQRRYNMNFYRELGKVAHQYGVKIAIENLFRYDDETHLPMETTFRSPYEMLKFLNELGDDFVACVDTGHANINGYQPSVMLDVLKEKVKVVHIHDNYSTLDSHFAPYCGSIDWHDFCIKLKEIGFDGVFSLEVHTAKIPMEDSFLEVKKEELRYLQCLARKMVEVYNL